jgi:hypothetical protein
MDKEKLKEVAGELENASKMHAGQAKKIKSMLKYKKSSGFKMKGYSYPGQSPIMKKNAAGKEQGIDGKACWKGYRYAGTEDGKDKCVPN